MLSDVIQKALYGVLFDDFQGVYDPTDYLLTLGTGGAVAEVLTATTAGNPGVSGGWLNVPTAASLHDYQSISTPTVRVEFLAGKPVHVEARIQLAEAAANSSNWYFGVTSVLTTGFVTNAGATPASYKGAVFTKPSGSNAIHFEVANATVKSTLTNIGTFVSGVPIVLSFDFDPDGGVTGYVLPAINGQSDYQLLPTKRQQVALAGLVPMYLSAGVNASTAAAETLQIDYWGVEAARI